MQGPFINRETFKQRLKQLFAPVLVFLAAAWSKIALIIKVGLPLLKMGGSLLVTLVIYGKLFGWRWAAGVLLLIFIHEMGHLIAARMVGLDVSLPLFIPFFGAAILLREMPRNAWIEAIIGIGGPILGSLGALAVTACYFYTGNNIFLALGYTGCLINLFNLIPIIPLDGGRIVSAVSPWLWIIGICILIPYLAYRALTGSVMALVFGVVVLFIVYTNSHRIVALFRGNSPAQARYFECTPLQRWSMGILYLGLAVSLFFGMTYIHHLLPPGMI